jgi:DNA-directed RNA polymerase specialized sigma24 family protein
VPDLQDEALRALLIENPEAGWRAFVDQYTPTLFAIISRAGVSDRDDATDVYVRVCEHLAANDCARLRRHDPRRGALASWLTVVVRHVLVDWLRAKSGRRRLFRAIRELDAFDRQVFELYYWRLRRPTEIAEAVRSPGRPDVDLGDVLEAIGRIHEVLTDRHRYELLAATARTMAPAELPDDDVMPIAASDPIGNPEQALGVRELDEHFGAALAALPPEDAAIIRLTFVQGWPRSQVRQALRLDTLTAERVTAILGRLRELLAARRIGAHEAATPGLSFLERET